MNVTKALMVIDSNQVLSRIPPSYFLKKETAADIFDGIFGPRTNMSLSQQFINQLAKHYIQLDFIEVNDLSQSRLKEAKIVVIMDSVSTTVLESIRSIAHRVLFLYESVIMDLNAHQPEYQKNFNFLFSYIHQSNPGLQLINYQYPVKVELSQEIVPFSQRKFCCMIASAKTSNWTKDSLRLREDFIRFFNEKQSQNLDLWGMGWENTEFAHSSIRKGSFEGSKHDLMARYRFIFCPENIGTVKDYITEKIWHAFSNGVIPLYMGPPNVNDYIPKTCYINLRDYLKDNGELDVKKLFLHMNSITEEQFEEYLSIIKEFLNSDNARRFSPEIFIEKFVNMLHFANN